MTRIQQLGFWEYLEAFGKHKSFIFWNFVVVSVVAVAISLALPKWYRSTATIIPTVENQGLLGAANLLGNLPASLGGLAKAPISNEAAIYLAILNSRAVLDSTIIRFDLVKRYHAKTFEDARRKLRDHFHVDLNDDGTIHVALEARTGYFSFGKADSTAKYLAYRMASYVITKLDEINRRLRTEKAHNDRVFIEKRYLKNLQDLSQAEKALRDFQMKYGAVSLPEQVQALITTMADLKAKLFAKEIETKVMAHYLSPSHPKLRRAREELNQLRKKYAELLGYDQNRSVGQSEETDILLRFSDIPELGLKYAEIYRELLTQQKIQEFILPQYEQAKIQEAKNTPTLQILDRPIVPERKAKPKRAYIVLAAAFLSLLFSVIGIYAKVNFDYLRVSDPTKYRRIMTAFQALTHFGGVRR